MKWFWSVFLLFLAIVLFSDAWRKKAKLSFREMQGEDTHPGFAV